MTPIDSMPVRFGGVDDDACDTFDDRTYCQMANLDDKISWVFPVEEETGVELIYCPDFIDDCCFSAGGGETGCDVNNQYWNSGGGGSYYTGLWSWSEGIVCNDDGGDLYQENVLTEVGLYKVTVVIAGFPNNQTNTGTFIITLGDAVTSAIDATVSGTYTFYMNVGSIVNNGIYISGSDESIFCLTGVSVKKVCEDYSFTIYDINGSSVGSFDTAWFLANGTGTDYGIQIENGNVKVHFTWGNLVNEAGCYYICFNNLCGANLLDNPNFDEDFNGDANIDEQDFADSWNPQGLVWASDIGNSRACHQEGFPFGESSISQSIEFLPNTTYSFTMTVEDSVVIGEALLIISAAGVVIYQQPPVDGVISITFTTGNSPTDVFKIEVEVGVQLCISGLLLVASNYICSECYDLKASHDCTKLLSWTNDDDAFGIDYDGTYDVVHYLRVYALFEKPRYQQEGDIFMYSDGEKKMLYGKSEKIWTLTIDYLPQYLHDAIAIGKIHDHFYVDGVEYICEAGNYEPEWRGRLKLAQGKLEVKKIIENNTNKNC